jgi:hypothetical protein
VTTCSTAQLLCNWLARGVTEFKTAVTIRAKYYTYIHDLFTRSRQHSRLVQDWLMSKKLDRDALTRLKNNYDSHSEWLTWQEVNTAEANNGEANDAEGGPSSRPGTPGTGDARAMSEEAPLATAAHEADMDTNDEAAETNPPVAGSVAAEAATSGPSTAQAPAAVPAETPAALAPVLRDKGPVWRALESVLTLLGAEPTTFSYEVPWKHYVQALRGPETVYRDADPTSWVHCCLRIFWPDDDTWYSGEVLEFRREDGKHRILYHDDDEEEWLDLGDEEAKGRVQWLTAASLDFWPPPPIPVVRALPVPAPNHAAPAPAAPTPAAPAPAAPAPAAHGSNLTAAIAAATAMLTPVKGITAATELPEAAPGVPHIVDGVEWVPPKVAESGEPIPRAGVAVGWRVSVYWDSDSMWDFGIVENYDSSSGKHRILFDDNQQEWVDLTLHAMRWHMPNGRDAAASARAEFEKLAQVRTQAALEAAQREAATKAAHAPASVSVVCNNLFGELLVKESVVRTERHGVVSPTEFERLAGKGSAKKWKVCPSVADPGVAECDRV